MVAKDIRWKEHVYHVVNKADITLRFLKRTFENRDPSLWKNVYGALVKSHLEYAVRSWNLHLVGDIEKLELVQRRGLKITEDIEHLSQCEFAD